MYTLEVSGQLPGVSSLLAPCGSQSLNYDQQAWWQMPLPTELSQHPLVCCLVLKAQICSWSVDEFSSSSSSSCTFSKEQWKQPLSPISRNQYDPSFIPPTTWSHVYLHTSQTSLYIYVYVKDDGYMGVFTELILATITKCLRLGNNNHQEFIAHNSGLSKIKALLASLWYGCLGLGGVLLLYLIWRKGQSSCLHLL